MAYGVRRTAYSVWRIEPATPVLVWTWDSGQMLVVLVVCARTVPERGVCQPSGPVSCVWTWDIKCSVGPLRD
eukprot:1634734-Rhodomonas_salina.2